MKPKQLDHRHHQPQPDKFPLCLLAQDVTDPANVGALFRLADAFGVERIYLTGTSPTPPNNKLRRTARNTDKCVPWTYATEALTLVQQLKVQGYRIVCLEITNRSVSIRSFTAPAQEKICLLLGAEDRGVDQPLLDCADDCVHIPMLGHNSSMNVAVACAIAVYQLTGYLPAN